MKTKHFFLTAIGAFALILNASATQLDLISGDGIQAPQPTVTVPSEDPEALVQKLYDYEQARIQREKAYLAHIKHEDLQMTDAVKGKESRFIRLSPSVPAHRASE